MCEERKVGSRLLKHLEISKSIRLLNEHNEAEGVPELIQLLKQGESIVLISDCGTPVFADPGTLLVQAATAAEIPVAPVPGASSLMAALVVSALDLKEFHYAGFLPRQSEDRLKALRRLQTILVPLVIYEAPYRLIPLLNDLVSVFGEKTPAVLCVQLTMAGEQIHRGALGKLQQHFAENPIKAEFVLIVDNTKEPKKFRRSKPRNKSYARSRSRTTSRKYHS